MEKCRICKFISILLGKKIFMPLISRNTKKIFLKDLTKYTKGINIKIVGGLLYRGYTYHDIDVVGDKKDLAVFIERIKSNYISNPIHYCGELRKHSHFKCALNGIKLVFTGKGY